MNPEREPLPIAVGIGILYSREKLLKQIFNVQYVTDLLCGGVTSLLPVLHIRILILVSTNDPILTFDENKYLFHFLRQELPFKDIFQQKTFPRKS
jgi:hypothetical protein